MADFQASHVWFPPPQRPNGRESPHLPSVPTPVSRWSRSLGGRCPIYEEKTQKDGTYQRNKKEKTRTNLVLVINSTYTVKRQANLQTFHMQVATEFQTGSKCGVRDIFSTPIVHGDSVESGKVNHMSQEWQPQTHTHTYIYIYIYLSVCLSVYLSIYLPIYVSMYLCIYVSMYILICIHAYINMYTYEYIYIYILICIHVYIDMFTCIYAFM